MLYNSEKCYLKVVTRAERKVTLLSCRAGEFFLEMKTLELRTRRGQGVGRGPAFPVKQQYFPRSVLVSVQFRQQKPMSHFKKKRTEIKIHK